MEPYTRADKRKLAFSLMVLLGFFVAIAGSIAWGAILVAKAGLSGVRVIFGA
jgi:hypothetical protein